MEEKTITKTGGRFQFLDGLRGIAALWVVFLHFHTLINERSSRSFPIIADAFFKHGHIGVNIFFVLSGFVIAYSVRQNFISFAFMGNFFMRRSIRLDPPYWASLLLLTALISIAPIFFHKGYEYIPSPQDFFLNAFYLQTFAGLKSILPVAWTLALEFQFYFIFILLVKAVQSINQLKSLSLFNYSTLFAKTLFGTVFLLSLIYASHIGELPSVRGLFIPYWYSFFIGCLLCWSMLKFVSETYLFLSFASIAIFYVWGDNSDLLITLVIALSIFTCIKLNKMHAFLSSYPFQYLGKISYSLYLIHWCVGTKFISLLSYLLQDEVNKIPSLGLLLLSALLSIAAASVFYRFIEQPCLKWSRQIKLEDPDSKKQLLNTTIVA